MPKFVKVVMNCAHASPTEVLDAGKVYAVDEQLAEKLCTDGSGADGKPAARIATAKDLAKKKTNRVPEKPDPGDKEVIEDDETDTEDDE